MFHWFAHHAAESGSYSCSQQFAVQTSRLSEREIDNMSSAVLKPEVAEFRPAGAGPSTEIRRFSAGMRAVTALLCTSLLFEQASALGQDLIAVLVAYCLWSAVLIWLEREGSNTWIRLWPYWIDVAWAVVVAKLTVGSTSMMIVTLVHPVVLATIGYGSRHGVALGLAACVGLVTADATESTMSGLGSAWPGGVLTAFTLALLPAAALLARPMSALRRSMALVDDFEASLDPRRGLEAVCADLVEQVRSRTQADVVAFVLPSQLGAPAMLASHGEGCFRVKADVHSGIETLLMHVPAYPVSHADRHRWDPRHVTRAWTADLLPQKLTGDLKELARTLGVRGLHIVPLTRYARPHGHVVVGYRTHRLSQSDLTALADAAPEMLRVVEQAALVDLLQEESAGHERARIGRDLHDSAIQPYLALKYAVESVALRIPPDNPARAEVDMLTELVNGEVAALRELISALRTGSAHGESMLVPAVRRQVKRFSTLFGIDIELDCPATLPTTRAVANSLLHMVNEVLNNIRRHTMARHVWVKLSTESQNIRLVVRDNGGTVRGLPAEEFNPTSLAERAAELGGFLTISRPDDLNTELVIQIPF